MRVRSSSGVRMFASANVCVYTGSHTHTHVFVMCTRELVCIAKQWCAACALRHAARTLVQRVVHIAVCVLQVMHCTCSTLTPRVCNLCVCAMFVCCFARVFFQVIRAVRRPRKRRRPTKRNWYLYEHVHSNHAALTPKYNTLRHALIIQHYTSLHYTCVHVPRTAVAHPSNGPIYKPLSFACANGAFVCVCLVYVLCSHLHTTTPW